MMQYYAKLKKQQGGGFLVTYADLPGCLTEGRNLNEALTNAKEVLDGWLAANCDRDLNIPPPRKRNPRGHYPISVNIQIEFAVRLRMLRKKRRLSQKEVADRLDISQQAYAKLETPLKTNPSLTTIQKLSDALDAEIDIQVAA